MPIDLHSKHRDSQRTRQERLAAQAIEAERAASVRAPLHIEVGGWSPRFAIANPQFYLARKPDPPLITFIRETLGQEISSWQAQVLAAFNSEGVADPFRIIGTQTGRTSSRGTFFAGEIPRVDRNRIPRKEPGDILSLTTTKAWHHSKVANFGYVYGFDFASIERKFAGMPDVEINSNPTGGPATMVIDPRELAGWKACFEASSVWHVVEPPHGTAAEGRGFRDPWPWVEKKVIRRTVAIPYAVATALETLARENAFDPFIARALFTEWPVESLSSVLDLGGRQAVRALVLAWIFDRGFANAETRAQVRLAATIVCPTDPVLALPETTDEEA